VLIGMGLAVGVTSVWATYWPTYRAEALLEVKAPGEEAAVGGRLPASASMQRRVETQERFVQAHKIFDLTGQDPNVQNSTLYQRLRKRKEGFVEVLKEHIHVAGTQDADALIVRLEGVVRNQQEQEDLALIVNAFCQAATKVARDRAAEAIGHSLVDLGNQKKQYVKQRKEYKDKIEKITTNEFLEQQAKLPILRTKTSMLEERRTELIMLGTQARTEYESLRALQQSGQLAASGQVQQFLQGDPVLRNLRSRADETEAALNTLTRKFGPEHPTVLNLRARLESLRDRTQQREADLQTMAMEQLLRSAQIRQEVIQDQLRGVDEELTTLSSSLQDLQGKLDKLTTAQAEVRKLDGRIADLTTRIDELERREKRETPLQMANSAVPPKQPSWPRWDLNIPLGVLIGLLVGLGLAFLLELVDTSIKGPADLLRRFDVPVLGAVPHSDDLEEEIPDVRLAFSSHPNSLIGEAFRQIRTCLLYSGPAEQRRSLLVTSPLPEDGRSTVTMNLAGAVAKHGRKVLVVDANFRQPMVRDLFAACPEGGLSSALVGQANWRDMVHEAGQNLYVMAAGPLPPNPAELLGSEQMQKMLWEMREEYDQVLIDGAPCLVVSDPCVLGTMVDGVVLVVRAQANTAGVVQRMRDMLDGVGAHVLGVVLNGMRATAGGYLRKNYDTFYEYHEQRELPAAKT